MLKVLTSPAAITIYKLAGKAALAGGIAAAVFLGVTHDSDTEKEDKADKKAAKKGLTPAQKGAATKAKNKAAKEADEAAATEVAEAASKTDEVEEVIE